MSSGDWESLQRAIEFYRSGRLGEAEGICREILRRSPGQAETLHLLGAIAGQMKRNDQAVELISRAIAIKPGLVEGYRSLAVVLSGMGRIDEGIELLRRAIGMEPGFAYGHASLGVALSEVGLIDEAISEFRRAVELAPGDANLHSNLVYSVQFHPGYDAKAILEEGRRWAGKFERAGSGGREFTNSREAERVLRIGYVGGEFSGHVVGRNVLPLLRNHDRGRFRIFCYQNSAFEDEVTRKFYATADGWRRIDGVEDAKVVEMIGGDGIDVLVDLSMHLGNNRLAVFGRRAAPVQVTFAGYPGTTGLGAMDYRLTDPYLDPPGSEEDYSEKSVRLPHSFWCYGPEAMAPADETEVVPLPALRNGFVTFGCLNHFRKVNEGVLEVWGKVMEANPGRG